ncbi:hypothetical protein QNH47_09800 [Virgibacillus halodenitrificans]|uniref:hypothetical protein n=1 Tax=Virgibacillus halodenitrificans TaxID=1482 RepID=UPI0024BF2236|nr:hypothetical protein [Virgibacillus halodenitrificans]WHX28116.1 hypothetical protein QNH47_09800 [Virgibacillus halodenitrificans]
MRKTTGFIVILLSVFIFIGCNNGLSGSKPPVVSINVDNKEYDTRLGTYCWNGNCVDTVGPVELLKEKAPVQVHAGEQITLEMEYTPKPNEIYLSQINNGSETEIKLNHNQFRAPDKKGTYFYAYSVSWLDEEDENLSHGDAFYAFAIEVQ